jgi:hypothetical protein
MLYRSFKSFAKNNVELLNNIYSSRLSGIIFKISFSFFQILSYFEKNY